MHPGIMVTNTIESCGLKPALFELRRRHQEVRADRAASQAKMPPTTERPCPCGKRDSQRVPDGDAVIGGGALLIRMLRRQGSAVVRPATMGTCEDAWPSMPENDGGHGDELLVVDLAARTIRITAATLCTPSRCWISLGVGRGEGLLASRWRR